MILIDDSSEESDDEQEPDAVVNQEEATYSESISVDRTSYTAPAWTGVTIGEKKTKTLMEVVWILTELSVAQVSDNSDFILEEGSIVNSACAQGDLVIEDQGVPVDACIDACIDEVPECSTALVPQPCTCVG